MIWQSIVYRSSILILVKAWEVASGSGPIGKQVEVNLVRVGKGDAQVRVGKGCTREVR